MAASDIRRAAVLLASLPADQGAALLSRLAPAQIEAVTLEIARLGIVEFDEQQAAIRQFSQSGASGIQGGVDLAGTLLHKALGSAAAGAVDSLRRRLNPPPFAFLATADGTAIRALLNDERPQTVALVLSRLPAAQSAAVLTVFDARERAEIAERISVMATVHPLVLRDVERALSARWAARSTLRVDTAHTSLRGPSRPSAFFQRAAAAYLIDAT